MARALLLICVACAAGCVRSHQVPRWAMHVAPPTVKPAATIEALRPRLMAELNGAAYQPSQLSPEQIAAAAVHELRRGRPWDASVLVAAASYRYYEQAFHAYQYGREEGYALALRETGGRLDAREYAKFLEAEVDAFRETSFVDELERIAAKLGASIEDDAVEEDLQRVAMGNMHDRYGAAEAFKERLSNLESPEPEQLADAALADALRDRLARDARREHHGETATSYLARVPIGAFRATALQTVPVHFDGLVVRAGARLHVQQPEAVGQALLSRRPETRSHAAVIAGVTESLALLPSLESLYARERDPMVKRSLLFALIRLGEHQHLPALIETMRSAAPAAAQHATTLLQWLPHDLEAQIPEQAVRALLADDGATDAARFVALALLRDVAAVRPLEPASLATLLNTVQALSVHDGAAPHLASLVAELDQLDRPRVLRALRGREAPLIGWLARWVDLAAPQDLPLLERLARESALLEQHGAQLVAVAGAIPGVAAQRLLEQWYAAHPALRTAIAIRLVLRDDVDKRRLQALTDKAGDAPATIMALALGKPEGTRATVRYLRSDDPEERYIAALAAKLFGGPELERYLWPSAAYHDPRYYPGDVRLRQLVLSALLDIQLNRHDTRAQARRAARL